MYAFWNENWNDYNNMGILQRQINCMWLFLPTVMLKKEDGFLKTQWAAVRIHLSEMMTAPHLYSFLWLNIAWAEKQHFHNVPPCTKLSIMSNGYREGTGKCMSKGDIFIPFTHKIKGAVSDLGFCDIHVFLLATYIKHNQSLTCHGQCPLGHIWPLITLGAKCISCLPQGTLTGSQRHLHG